MVAWFCALPKNSRAATVAALVSPAGGDNKIGYFNLLIVAFSCNADQSPFHFFAGRNQLGRHVIKAWRS